jgi:hypothetical protein
MVDPKAIRRMWRSCRLRFKPCSFIFSVPTKSGPALHCLIDNLHSPFSITHEVSLRSSHHEHLVCLRTMSLSSTYLLSRISLCLFVSNVSNF